MTMTVSDSVPLRQYTGTGAQVAFSVPFEFRANADLVVRVNGAIKVLNTDYTLSGAGVSGGGTCTFTVAPVSGASVVIYGDMAIARLVNSYASYGPLPADVLEADLDDVTMKMRQLERDIARSLRLAPYDTAAATTFELNSIANRASKILRFDANGAPEFAASIGSTVLSRTVIGGYLYPQTAAEVAAAVTPTDYAFPAGDVNRYGLNDVPGTTDMTVAFQRAVLANDYVWVPDGDYLISNNIALRAGTHFVMDGGTLLKASIRDWNATGVLRAVGVSNVTISGGNIDGQKASNTTGECFGIDLRGASNVRIQGVRVINMPGADAAGTTGGDGIYVGFNGSEASPSQNVIISGNILDGNVRQGISIVGGVGVTVVGNQLINASGTNPGGGIDVEANGATNNLRDIQIIGNRVEGNYYGIIVTTSARNVTVQGNTLRDNGFVDIYVADCSYTTVAGNTIESVTKDAITQGLIYVNSAQHASIIGNILRGIQSDTEERAGINVNQGDYIVISQNEISNMRTQAIVVGNSAQPANFTDVSVLGNMCIDNVVAAGTEAVIAVSGNSGGGFYPSRVTLRGNHIFDSRSAGNEADKGIEIATAIPAATRAGYRMSDNLVSGPTAPMTAGTSPPLTAIFTWDPASLADGVGETSAAITVTGAALNDAVEVFAPYDLQGITATGYVSATDTVRVRLQNESGGVLDLASSTSWRVRVRKFFE